MKDLHILSAECADLAGADKSSEPPGRANGEPVSLLPSREKVALPHSQQHDSRLFFVSYSLPTKRNYVTTLADCRHAMFESTGGTRVVSRSATAGAEERS
jgi:hypothetical protein